MSETKDRPRDQLWRALRTRVKERRATLELMPADLDRAIGARPGYINNLELRETLPSLERLAALAQALQCTTDSLLGLDLPAITWTANPPGAWEAPVAALKAKLAQHETVLGMLTAANAQLDSEEEALAMDAAWTGERNLTPLFPCE